MKRHNLDIFFFKISGIFCNRTRSVTVVLGRTTENQCRARVGLLRTYLANKCLSSLTTIVKKQHLNQNCQYLTKKESYLSQMCLLLCWMWSGIVICEMAEDNEATLQRSQSTPEPIFDPKSSKEVTIGEKNNILNLISLICLALVSWRVIKYQSINPRE